MTWKVMVGDVTLQQFHTKPSIPNSNKVLLSQTYGIQSLGVSAPPPSSWKITEYINKLKTAQREQLSDMHVTRAEFLCVVFVLSAHEKQTRFRKEERLFTRTKYTLVHITYFLDGHKVTSILIDCRSVPLH